MFLRIIPRIDFLSYVPSGTTTGHHSPFPDQVINPFSMEKLGKFLGLPRIFFVHPVVLVPRLLSGVVSETFSILEFLVHSVASLLFSEASLSLLCASSSSYSLTLSGIMSSAFVSSCTWMPCSSTQLPRTSRTSANGWNFFLLM